MLSSIHEGLRAAQRLWPDLGGILVWPVDCPRVRPDTVRLVLDVAAREKAALVKPGHEGRSGHPAFYSARIFPEIFAVPLEMGLRVLAGSLPPNKLALRVEVMAAEVLDDIDTPEDHERIRRAAERD
jgi:CTP:molybdopterin cytidylyltransferase MocA